VLHCLGVLTRNKLWNTISTTARRLAWSAASEIARVALERYPLISVTGGSYFTFQIGYPVCGGLVAQAALIRRSRKANYQSEGLSNE
jgi:hypothetical protein